MFFQVEQFHWEKRKPFLKCLSRDSKVPDLKCLLLPNEIAKCFKLSSNFFFYYYMNKSVTNDRMFESSVKQTSYDNRYFKFNMPFNLMIKSDFIQLEKFNKVSRFKRFELKTSKNVTTCSCNSRENNLRTWIVYTSSPSSLLKVLTGDIWWG
jgi:hypothetical protein